MIAVKSGTKTAVRCVYGDDCPLHAKNPPFNAQVLASFEESRAIMRGDVPAKRYKATKFEQALKDLDA